MLPLYLLMVLHVYFTAAPLHRHQIFLPSHDTIAEDKYGNGLYLSPLYKHTTQRSVPLALPRT